jgi:hypothetical protein
MCQRFAACLSSKLERHFPPFKNSRCKSTCFKRHVRHPPTRVQKSHIIKQTNHHNISFSPAILPLLPLSSSAAHQSRHRLHTIGRLVLHIRLVLVHRASPATSQTYHYPRQRSSTPMIEPTCHHVAKRPTTPTEPYPSTHHVASLRRASPTVPVHRYVRAGATSSRPPTDVVAYRSIHVVASSTNVALRRLRILGGCY